MDTVKLLTALQAVAALAPLPQGVQIVIAFGPAGPIITSYNNRDRLLSTIFSEAAWRAAGGTPSLYTRFINGLGYYHIEFERTTLGTFLDVFPTQAELLRSKTIGKGCCAIVYKILEQAEIIWPLS